MGTACAVGHLIRLDGRENLVDQVAATSNHIRIEDVRRGPLVDWMYSSGLTQEECALIQPSYATIEDYRRAPPWQNEEKRLGEHFAKVEHALREHSQLSLGEALVAKLDAELEQDPKHPAFSLTSLSKSLRSKEPNVRIAAAYGIARVPSGQVTREMRLSALRPNLADPDPAVRFWTVVALESIGSASARGTVELHSFTLPVFLETFRGHQQELRLPALIQMANTAPECIGTYRQLRIVPEVRRAFVDAASDKDRSIREFALNILSTWRWQRTAYESQRMRRHYLAASHELEGIAAEALAMGREFADPPPSVKAILERRSLYDVAESITYLLPIGTATVMPVAATKAKAMQLVEDYHRTKYADVLNQENPPTWSIESADPDEHGLYFVVPAWRTDMNPGPKLVYVIPRPSMLSAASSPPHSWLETIHQSEQYIWPAAPASMLRPHPDVQIVLGDAARNELPAFTAACDVFAYFMAYYAMLVIDREVQETDDEFNWTGRLASVRQHKTRFFELGGGGSSNAGGGGWDFHRLTMSCDRSTGKLSLAVEPIEFAVTPLPAEILAPPWVTKELKLMGWKPLKQFDFFGDRLLPPEYAKAVERFNPDDAKESRELLYRRWAIEKSLPQPYLILGLLFDRAGKREEAIRWIKQAVGQGANEPNTLADVARWELSVKKYGAARAHAESALELWPDQSTAKKVLRELTKTESASEASSARPAVR
jgi:tetratricopeptide (TPR) repeat protein